MRLVRLVDAVAADLECGHEFCFVFEPLGPAFADLGFVDIGFCEFYEEVVVAGFAFHEAAVELAEVGVFESLAKAFKAFAAAGFDEGEDEEPVEEAGFFAAAFAFEFHELVDILVFSLGPEAEVSFFELGQHQAEVPPFFGDDGGEVCYEFCFGRVALDEADAAGSGFLFAPGVIGEDVFEGDRGEVDPARVGGELQAEDVLWAGGCFHGVKLRFTYFSEKFEVCGKKVFWTGSLLRGGRRMRCGGYDCRRGRSIFVRMIIWG